MISARFAPATIVLTTLALIPTVRHSYLDVTATKGPKIQDLVVEVEGQHGAPTARATEWAVRKFDSEDWIQRSFYSGGVILTVVRSYDPKRLYHHPELAAAYPDDYQAATVMSFPSRADLPVFVLQGQNLSADKRSMYALQYGGRFVSNPIAFQLRTSMELLFSRRKPMTLFFVQQVAGAGGEQPETSRGARVLLAAVNSFAAQRSDD